MNIKGIIIGGLISYITAGLFILVAAILVYYNLITVQTASIVIFIGALLGIFLGSAKAARSAYSKVIINALLVSLMFILLIIIGAISLNGTFAPHARTTALIISTLAAGVLGAMFGNR